MKKSSIEIIKDIFKAKLEKANFPIGTIHTYNGRSFKKIAEGKWEHIKDQNSQSRNRKEYQKLWDEVKKNPNDPKNGERRKKIMSLNKEWQEKYKKEQKEHKVAQDIEKRPREDESKWSTKIHSLMYTLNSGSDTHHFLSDIKLDKLKDGSWRVYENGKKGGSLSASMMDSDTLKKYNLEWKGDKEHSNSLPKKSTYLLEVEKEKLTNELKRVKFALWNHERNLEWSPELKDSKNFKDKQAEITQEINEFSKKIDSTSKEIEAIKEENKKARQEEDNETKKSIKKGLI